MLIINDISLRIAGRLLIDHASVTLSAGTKAGLVGRNGTGKTTLFRAITGDFPTETGSISMPKNTRIGQVAQEAPGTEDSLIEIVLAADKERAALVAEETTATDPDRIAEIHMRLAERGQDRVRLAAMMGLVVEQMRQRRRQPLRHHANVGHCHVGEPSGQIFRGQGAHPFDDPIVFRHPRGAQALERPVDNRVERIGRLAHPGKTLHPDAVGGDKVVQSAHHRPEECAGVLLPLLVGQPLGRIIEALVGPAVVGGKHHKMLLHGISFREGLGKIRGPSKWDNSDDHSAL